LTNEIQASVFIQLINNAQQKYDINRNNNINMNSNFINRGMRVLKTYIYIYYTIRERKVIPIQSCVKEKRVSVNTIVIEYEA
tara:strand:- start:76 stop:321 length:246 start_codon:yes stop_codon:yes gene_type:complete